MNADTRRDELASEAAALFDRGHHERALHLYLALANGWLEDRFALPIAECYEALGRFTEARFWAGRAVQVNPASDGARATYQRLGRIDADEFAGPFAAEFGGRLTAEDVEETLALLAGIPGGPALIDWFDGHVSFHDAEVASLELNRKGESRLRLVVGWPAAASVVFVLEDWIDTTLLAFSHQNVIGDLVLRRRGARPLEVWERGVGATLGEYEIELTPIYGAYGTIRAGVKEIEFTVLHERGR